MSKVKLLVVEGNGTNNSPYIGGTERIVNTDIELPENITIAEVIRYDFDVEEDGGRRASDDIVPLIQLEHINQLVGKVLTIVDATLADPEQRKAAKDLIKESLYGWYMGRGDPFAEAWRKDKFPNYEKAFDVVDPKREVK